MEIFRQPVVHKAANAPNRNDCQNGDIWIDTHGSDRWVVYNGNWIPILPLVTSGCKLPAVFGDVPPEMFRFHNPHVVWIPNSVYNRCERGIIIGFVWVGAGTWRPRIVDFQKVDVYNSVEDYLATTRPQRMINTPTPDSYGDW